MCVASIIEGYRFAGQVGHAKGFIVPDLGSAEPKVCLVVVFGRYQQRHDCKTLQAQHEKTKLVLVAWIDQHLLLVLSFFFNHLVVVVFTFPGRVIGVKSSYRL